MSANAAYQASKHIKTAQITAGLLLLTLSAGLLAPLAARAQTPAMAGPVLEFNIPAQSLNSALLDFAERAGLELVYDFALVEGRRNPPLNGAYTASEGLDRLLADSGINYEFNSANSVSLDTTEKEETEVKEDPAESLPRLDVEGKGVAETGAERDLRRKDEIFDEDISTDYLGKEDIDRFRGISTADVFQGLTNVYSGAARNGGALDANIRGIQGAGRAPVIIDGTEQAIVINRGYRGAGNRSYIDPSLISGIQALKGPVSVREVNSQIGGAIAIKTLGAEDILRPGETFGLELRLEAGNNATAPRLPTLRTGQDARNIKGFPLSRNRFQDATNDPTLRVQPRTKDDNDTFSFGSDRAARIAAAGRKGDFDFFGAYAYRSRGNYFSGRNNADYYADEDAFNASIFWMRQMAFAYRPGNEVTNSSSQMQSWLFKSTWRIADDQALQLGYRNTRTATGEIMPSRVRPTEDVRQRVRSDQRLGDIQWPLSRTRIDALNLEYKYAPETRWLDVHANLWTTRARSNTYSSGGFPNVPITREDTTLINTALNNSRNNRWGVTFSNKMALLPSVDLTVGGHYQYEKLRSDDEPPPKGHISSFSTAGREGNRQEYRANIQLEWRPTSFLTFNGGVGHAGYRGFDDGLNARLKRGETVRQTITTGYKRGYELQTRGEAAYRAINPPPDLAKQLKELESLYGLSPGTDIYELFAGNYRREAADYEKIARSFKNKSFSVPGSAFSLKWLADANGKFRRAGILPRCPPDGPGGVRRPAPIGAFDLAPIFRQIEARNKDLLRPENNHHLKAAVRNALSGASCGGSTEFSGPINKTTELKSPADNPVWRASGWEPYLTVTLKLSDAIRLYGRYAERLRFPSVFESTSGFSANVNLARPLKPERMRSWEGAYIQDFSALFGLGGEGQRADFKLVYFHNTIRDVIDREGSPARFTNLDKQVIDGVELQARLDTGRFFLNLGATRILTHEVCDESTAAQYHQGTGLYPDDCVNDGFIGGYLQTQAIPAQTLNLTLGGRFFERRLELGTRLTWYSEYDDRQAEKFSRRRSPLPIGGDPRKYTYSHISNPPLSFGKTLVLDAYARYNFNDQLTAELVSTNLTDQYYADPLSRTLMPAPGRQIRLNFTYQF